MTSRGDMLTIREAYVQASSLLREAIEQQADADSRSAASQTEETVQDPQQVCEWMLLYLLGWDRAELFLRFDDPFPPHKRVSWQKMIQRKLAGEPVQYIIGTQHFYGYEFQVTPDVLIPRPETELLVEAVIDRAQQLWPSDNPIVVADVGTGSGAIAVTIALERRQWSIHASDLSKAALAVAVNNATTHRVEDRITFHEGDLLMPFIERTLALDVIVSNPPYIPTAEMNHLQHEVRDYEPKLALDGGADGLDSYRQLMNQLALLPRYPRLLGLEVGRGQAQLVRAMLESCGQWSQIDIVLDLAGIERHLIGWRT